MSGTVDDRYLEWLYESIGSVKNRNPARSYWHLIRQLYSKEFVWSVANDDNRIEDALALRLEFIHGREAGVVDPHWMDLGCSMIEMLIALARRVAYASYGTPGDWFWKFIENLGLRNYSDMTYSEKTRREVNHILDTLINRTYERDGHGGLFPLHSARRDQRKVEIWVQMSAYLLEGEHYYNGPRV